MPSISLTTQPGVVGFYGASSAERLPTERAITAQIESFKSIHLSVSKKEILMQTPKSSQARAKYEAGGFYLFPEPVIDKAVIQRAAEGMDAVRAGEYENGPHRRGPSGLEPRR